MPDQITTAFVQDYKTTIMMLTQQMGSRLRGLVTTDSYTGKAGKAVEQFGATKAVKRTSRHADTPTIDVPQSARWVYPTDYEWADMIDDQDKLRMLIEPTSPIAQAGAMAMGRAVDDEILAAIYGTAKTGENGTTNTTFDTTNQIVGPNVGGTNSGLNVAKLREAKRILMANNVDLDMEKLYCVITSKEHDSLLNEIQIVSSDFNSQPVLVDGRVKSFLGINFVHMEFGDTTAFTNATSMLNGANRYVPLFTDKAYHLGIWDDMQAKISERGDKGYATQVYLKQTIGATRLDEKKSVRIECV